MLEDVLVTHSSAFRTSLHNLSGNEAAVSYHGMAEDFRLVIGLIRELRSPFLRNRHREAVEDILGFSISAIPQRDGAGGDLAEAPSGSTKLDAARLSVTLGHLIERHAIKALPAIKAITTRATHEAILYQSLDEVRTTWAGAEFVVLNYNGRKDAPTLACIQVLVDDVQKDMAALVQLLESPHVSYIREELEGWHASLVKLAMQLDALTEIQSGLTRLTFQLRVPESSSVSRVTSFDLGSLIPVAERVLNDTEPWWRDLMTSISSEPSVLRAALLPAMKQQELEKHRSGLHMAMNEIRSHLQSRREAFPRLYLCADDALLPSIAQTSLGNAAALASPIIRSCFPAVSTFELGIGSKISKDILITSPDGGHISILFDFKMRCALEEWLHALNLAMHRAVAKGLKPCLRLALKLETMGSLPSTTNEVEEDADSKQVSLENSPLSQFWMDQPIQCIVIAAQVVWCRSTEFALRSNDHGALVDVTVKRESQCASIVTTLRGVSNRTAVMAISALLLAASNAAETARDLAKLKVCSSEDFHWSATLRFEPRYSPARIAQPTEASYSSGPSAPSEEHAPRAHGRSVEPTEDILDPLEDCEQIMICLGGVHPIQYGLEYVGAAHARLLVTQASERCWLSLLTLVNSGFGVRLTGSGVSTNRQLASTAASFAAIIGEPFFSVDCTTAGMAMNSETSDVLPWACSQLLRCVAHTHTHWGCFCGLDTLGCDALVIFEAAITEVLNKSRLTETSCGHRFPRIVVTTLCSEQITHNYCSQDLHGSAFRSLAAATPDIARTVILHLNVHGIERAEPLGRRIASFWTCLPGLVVSSTQSCTGLGSVHGLAQILNCLSKWSGDNESLHLVDLSRVSRDHPHAIVIAKLRAQILRMFSRVLDTSALDALLHDIFSEAYNVPTFCPQQQVQESPFEDDTKTVWSALAALAPLRWKFAPSGDFVFQARRLHDALLNRQDNSSKTAGMVGLIGDPGSGKTTLSFAAAALATASHGVEEGPKGIARPLLSIVATNALPVEHLWGSFLPDGTWRDGAASAMMRAASMVSGPQINLPVSDAAKCGFAAGARWVLFDVDGANLFPHSCVTDDVGTDTGSASQLEVICAPLIFGDLWTHTAGECSIVNRCNTVQLASGEHILCGPQMRLLVECGTHTGLAPSTLVLFNLFHVDETVISWYELGCAWATNACTGFFEIKSKGPDSDAGEGQGVTLPSRESIAEEQKLLSSFRSRLLDLLQCVFRPMLNELNEMMSLGMHISPPPPKTAVRSLANHFDTILLDINPKALSPILLAASSALEKGPRSHESTVACLIDPLFVFATAWALGSCVVDNIPLRTRLEAALQACIIAEDLTQSAKLPAEGKNLASIFDFWPAIVLIEQTKKSFPGNDAERLVSKSFSADQIGGISPSDFSMLFAEEASSLQVQGPSLTRGHLPPGFDLAFAGSMTHGTEDEVVPIAPITDVKEVDPPRGTPTIDENYFKQSIVKVRWTHWPSTLSTQSSIGLVDPSHILVGSSAQFRASKLLNSASCGSQRIGALLLGPHGSGKTTIAKFALLGNPKPGIDASSMPVSESKLTVSICAAVTATQLHAQLASFGLKGRSCALSIFIDDISVPRFGQGTPRGCGDCPRELIRGLMSHCGAACAPSIAFCSATLDPELCMRCAISSWKPLRQPLRLLATAPVAGPLLSERFKRHFWIYELGSLDESSLRAILAPYTQAAMQSTENHTAGLLVTETLSDIILSTAKVLPPVPSRPCGALRGLHDVVRIIGGIAAGARLNHDILRKSASLNPTSLASLCLHECRRVLGDPLGSQREQIILEERLASITAYHFNVGGSAWDCKALFRDPERPLVFVDLPQSHQQQGEVMKTGFDDPIDVKNRREICRSATQLRSILDFHASSHSTSTQGIQHSEVGEDSIGRVPPVNKNTLIAGDGALRVAGVLHALHRQRHMFLIGKPGDQRPAMISLASHIAGLGLVVARGASNEEEFGKHILVALRHAVLTAAKAAAHDPNGPRRKTSKIVVLINDESLAACRSGERSVFQLGSTDNLNISLDVLQAIVRDGDVDGKLFSAYSKATDKEIKDAFHAASSLLAGREGSVTCVGACSSEYTDGNFPVSIRSAIAASTLRSVSIAIALESDSHASLLQHIRLGYPALAALFQMNYHCLDQADKCVASMEHVLRRRLAQLQLDTEFMTVPVNEITSLCCAAFAALDTMPSKETLPSLLMDVADSTPTIAMNWYQGLQSRRRGLLTALDGYQSLVEALPLEMPDLPSDSSGATTTERILCLLSIEAADWSRQLGLIDKRIQSLFADAMMHAIDVRLATGQHSLQGRLSTCAAAKRCLNLTGLSADSFELNGATITYPYEAAVHAKLADVVTERLVFRYANAHPDNELLVSTWRAQGCLPRGISTASLALATVHSLRWPLIIDPGGICTRWIRSAECSAESEFVEVTPATALCARRVLRNSIIRERSLLMNVDKIPVCCSDSTVFEDSLTLQKSVHITSFPGTIGFRLYCVASTSSTVLTNVAITMFNVIVFFIDDVSLRTSLGLSAAATIFHDFETMLNSSFYSVCRATASVSVAENALARVLGVVFNDSECKPPCYKSHASPAVNTSQVFSLVKELDDALVKSSTLTRNHAALLRTNELRAAFTAGAVGAAGHLATANVSMLISSFKACVDVSTGIFLSNFRDLITKHSRPVTATDTSASLEKGILIAFLENAICALPHESISLFTIEIFRCCAIQRKLVTMDLALGDTFTKATALNHAVSTSRRWQLLADGGMESPSQPSKLPTYAKAFMAQFAEILTASLSELGHLEMPWVTFPSSCKRAGLFQSPSWKEVNLASSTGQKPRPCEYFAPKRQILFRLLLRLACLPHEAQGTARGIVRDAYDKLTASSHVIQESKERVNLDDLTTHKLNRALSVISGPLSAKKVAGASLLNLLLIGDGFTQDDSIHEDSIFSFVRGLAGKFGVPCVRIVEHGSRGKLTMSALEIRATNSKPKVVGRFLSQEEICRFVNDARSTGEWVLLHQLENFQEASISWISQLCTDSPAESSAGFRLLFSTNMAHVAIRRLQASVQCCARVFRCWNSRWIAAASESSQSCEISCQNVDGTSAPQPGHTVGSPISSNLPDPFDSLASNYRIRIELQFKFNASSGIYGNAEARVLYRALMMRLPQRLELDVIGQSRSWRTLSLKVEADRHNALIDLCHNTLSKLVGGANTFPEHGDIIAKISAGLTPARWVEATQHFSLVFAGRCIANPRLDAWLRSLQERVEYLRKWISDRGPLRLWLGVLFSPQSYLQGALLDVTRDRSSRFESMSFVAAPFLATDDVAISPGSILAEGFLLFHVSRRLASEVLVTNKNAPFFHNSGVAPLLLLSPGPRRSSNLSLKEQPDLNKAVECPVYSYRQSVFIRLLTAHLPAALGPEVCSERTAYLLC